MDKIKNNFTLKVLSLFIAIIMWSYVMGRENPVIPRDYKNIKVELTNIESLERDNLVVMDPKEFTVNVRIEAKKSDLDRNKFSSKDILASVDMSGYQEGNVKVPVKIELLNQSSNIEVVSWEPKDILFNIDEYITKEKTVTIKTVGNISEDFIIEEITAKPSVILIKGPRSWVNQVSEVVGIVDITNRNATSNLTVPVKLLDDKGNNIVGVEKEPGVVDVNMPIRRSLSLPIELQTENELPENFIISDMKIFPSTVGIKGDNSILELSSIMTETIDINTLLDKDTMEVELVLPEGVELLDPNQKVRISYKVEELVRKEFVLTSSNLDMRNIDTNLRVDSIESLDNIKINLKGTKEILDEIKKEDIIVYLDLRNLDKGSNSVEIEFADLEGITLENIIPGFVNVELKVK